MSKWLVGAAVLAGLAFMGQKTMYADKRGLRNNNPGNIRHGDNWKGMAADQSDSAFIRFQSPEWGIRAMGRVLINYQRLYGLNTVRGIISRWAPDSENETESYIRAVSADLGVSPDQPLVLAGSQLRELVKAITHHENGQQPYSDELIGQGLALA